MNVRFSVHQLVADAIDDNDTRAEAVRRVQENLKNRRTVLSTLEQADPATPHADRPSPSLVTVRIALSDREAEALSITLRCA